MKPEILEDSVTAGLDDMAFRLFIACISLADDYGRLRAEPSWLMGQVYWSRPADRGLFEKSLATLMPLIRFYEVKDQRYAEIRNWSKHQKVDRPGKPRIPAPPEFPAEPSRESRVILASVSRDPRESLATDLGPRTVVPPTTDHSTSETGEARVEVEAPEPEQAKHRYRRAYCAGISAAKGSPFAWPSGPAEKFADQDLGNVIATFAFSQTTAQAHRGEKLLGWIEAAAADFAEHVMEGVKAGKDDPKYWSSYNPKGLLRFLNQDAQATEARDVG